MRGPSAVNPLLQQVLYRRRMVRYARFSLASWVFFGGLHIAVWWGAFDHTRAGWAQAALGAMVWPLLLAATASFICLVVFTARWFLAPGNPQDYSWLERKAAEQAAGADGAPEQLLPGAHLVS